jgi:hypothetical protein
MKLITSRVPESHQDYSERSEQILTLHVHLPWRAVPGSTGAGERSRNVDVLISLVLRLQDLEIHSVFPLSTEVYNGNPSRSEKRTAEHRGSVCS